jgi:dsDNA-binding SOS-regulon protein
LEAVGLRQMAQNRAVGICRLADNGGNKMKPTEKMIEFAEAIAETLNIREPDYDNYEEVSAFIAKNKDDYYQRAYDNNEI